MKFFCNCILVMYRSRRIYIYDRYVLFSYIYLYLFVFIYLLLLDLYFIYIKDLFKYVRVS